MQKAEKNGAVEVGEDKNELKRARCVKGLMKSILKKQKDCRMRQEKLVRMIVAASDSKSPDYVAKRVAHLANKSRRFENGKYIKLIPKVA